MTFERIAPAVFVLIWSTGWIAAGYAAPYADAMTFLMWRFFLASVTLGVLALAMGAPWPKTKREWFHAGVAGALINAYYLAGVWWAVRQGLPAGISGLIAALQPILTAMLAPFILGERNTPRQWLGIGIGFIGIVMVLAPKILAVDPTKLSTVLIPIAANVVGMISVTFGSIYHKRYVGGGDLRTQTTIQYGAAALAIAPLAYLFEPMQITWNTTIILTMLWSVLALSIGAIMLYLVLIRRGAVSRAATLIYLIPPLTAVETWFLFGEKLSPLQIAGILVTTFGVMLALSRKQAAPQPQPQPATSASKA